MLRSTLLISMLALFGCDQDTPTSPARSIDGVWRIISIEPAMQSARSAPTGVLYQVEFENGRTLVRVDCNTCTGPFASDGQTLTIGPVLACTRAACQTAAFETAVLALLSGSHQTTITTHNLTLASSRGTVLLQR